MERCLSTIAKMWFTCFANKKTKQILCVILVLNVILLFLNTSIFYLIYDPKSERSWISNWFGFMVEPKKVENIEDAHRTTKSYWSLSSYDNEEIKNFLKYTMKTPGVCQRLIKNVPGSVDEATKYMEQNPKKFTRDGDYAYIIGQLGCGSFKSFRSYNLSPVSEEEANFPLAFGIVMYRDVEQFERLLRAIYQPQNYYCVHVDLKASSATHAGVQAIASCFKNVFVASNLVEVAWGHFTALKSHLLCAEQLLAYKKWKYFINLTGQEFPLLSNRQIVRILKILNGTNEIQGGLGQMSWDKDRWRYKWIYGRRGFTRTDILKSPSPHGLNIEKGAVHIAASRPFIDFIINNQICKEFLQWLEDTFVPDEAFFSTLNHDRKLCAPGGYYGDSSWKPFIARFVNWHDDCGGKKVRTVCILGVKDIGPLMHENRKMFANKLYHDYQYLALDCLESYHRQLTEESRSPNFKFDEYYYRNLPQVLCKECKVCPGV